VSSRDSGPVHRNDAAVGVPRFPARRSGGVPALLLANGGGGRGTVRRERPRRWRTLGGRRGVAGEEAGRDGRRPFLACPAAGAIASDPTRRADGRFVVPPAQGRALKRAAARGD